MPNFVTKIPFNTLTTEKQKELMVSANLISILAFVIQNEHQIYLVDTKFADPILNQKAKRIREDAHDIVSRVWRIANPHDKAKLEIEDSIAIQRVLRFFSMMDEQDINNVMDKLEEMIE